MIVTELSQPLTVRRLVSFGQAVYDGAISIEGVRAERADGRSDAFRLLDDGIVPVLVDPECRILSEIRPDVLIDARMVKQVSDTSIDMAALVIGLGPGFFAGENCHAVVETVRGPFLGRVIWNGPAERNTGIPDAVGTYRDERVLRAPVDGVFHARAAIGDTLAERQVIGDVNGEPVLSPFRGILRGLIQNGLRVPAGLKVGDVDPRIDARLCRLVSDKSLAIGGGVLEAILSWEAFK